MEPERVALAAPRSIFDKSGVRHDRRFANLLSPDRTPSPLLLSRGILTANHVHKITSNSAEQESIFSWILSQPYTYNLIKSATWVSDAPLARLLVVGFADVAADPSFSITVLQ